VRSSRYVSLLPAILVVLAACAATSDAPAPALPVTTALPSAPPATPAPPILPGHSIDRTAMDLTVRPGADFFLFANGAWLAKAEIPADRSSTGTGLRLTEEAEQQTSDLLAEASRTGAPDVKNIGDYYASIMDEAGIEARGLKPLAATLARISKVADARALASLLGAQLRADVDALNATNFYTDHVLGLWVEQDLNDPSRYAPYLLQGGLGMPDRSYYVGDAPRQVAMRPKYVAHVAAMFRLAGIRDVDAKAARVVAFEGKIAQTHASRVESEDVTKANNAWGRADFATRAPGMSWDAFFAAAGLDKQPTFIVWHPGAVTGLAALVKSEPLAVWQDYLTARALDHAAELLPKAFADEHFAFYSTELQGVPVRPARWKRAVALTTHALGEAVGKVYVAKYFPPESKKAIEKMVADITLAFGRRIDGLTWMSPSTKAKAKDKLATLKVGIGYPDVWRDYSALSVVRGDALGNAERAEAFDYQRNVAKLGKPIDRGEWAMVPQVVNAVNLPVKNALNFPAGILRPPFFDANATPAANYGGIGAIIGHEISHSFDDEGAKFDAQGRFASWWTPGDLAHFEASGAALAAQFSAYHPLPDLAIDGKLTLSENIADLAGLAASYDAWRSSLGGQPPPTQDGWTGEQQFFLSLAQCRQSKMRDPALRQLVATNGHAPSRYRALTVRNVDAWYDAFDVKPSDALFLAPAARVRVW
jgi:putative endopeptidase